MLHDKGYADVRPLLGGFDAWREAGFPVESAAPVRRRVRTSRWGDTNKVATNG